MDLYGNSPKDLFLDILDEISEGRIQGIPEVINNKLASMACKAAVNANQALSTDEIKGLLASLAALKNSTTCPHGRPIVVKLTSHELEKRFRRCL